jgi:hypothetical protein
LPASIVETLIEKELLNSDQADVCVEQIQKVVDVVKDDPLNSAGLVVTAVDNGRLVERSQSSRVGDPTNGQVLIVTRRSRRLRDRSRQCSQSSTHSESAAASCTLLSVSA